MNLIATLWIIYTTACHASLCTTALDCLSVSCHCHCTALIQTLHREREVGFSAPFAAAAGALGLCKVLCWLPLIATRNTPFLPCTARQSPSPHRATTDGDRPSTLVSHCQHSGLLSSMAYCATLGGAFDHWSCSAVDDVTIIDHFVKWTRQALILYMCIAWCAFKSQWRRSQSWYVWLGFFFTILTVSYINRLILYMSYLLKDSKL